MQVPTGEQPRTADADVIIHTGASVASKGKTPTEKRQKKLNQVTLLQMFRYGWKLCAYLHRGLFQLNSMAFPILQIRWWSR